MEREESYELTYGARDTAVVVEVPHAGLDVPRDLEPGVSAPADALWRDADLYVDELYADAPSEGGTLLTARCSRYVVDLNRGADDIDIGTVEGFTGVSKGNARGVVWRLTTDGRVALPRPLSKDELASRLARFHTPYHSRLGALLAQTKARHGFVVLVAGHSMPSIGRAGHTDPGSRRADVVPGTLGRTSAHPALIDLVDAHFRAAGLSVRHDDPYRGGFTTRTYGQPREQAHAIQIELSRSLYMNEATGERRPAEMSALRNSLRSLIKKLSAVQADELKGP